MGLTDRDYQVKRTDEAQKQKLTRNVPGRASSWAQLGILLLQGKPCPSSWHFLPSGRGLFTLVGGKQHGCSRLSTSHGVTGGSCPQLCRTDTDRRHPTGDRRPPRRLTSGPPATADGRTSSTPTSRAASAASAGQAPLPPRPRPPHRRRRGLPSPQLTRGPRRARRR